MTKLESGRLHVSGTQLVDTLGREVLLRGVNAGGRSKMPPFLPVEFSSDEELRTRLDALFAQIAGWGCNVLRVPFTWEAVEPVRGHIDETFLRRYQLLLDSAWAHGLRSILDFHQDVYASPFFGDGFPLWTLGDIPHGPPRHDAQDGHWFLQYRDADSPVVAAFERLWHNADGIFDAFTSMWRLMAQRFGAHPGVIGCEIINEPGWGRQDPFEFEKTTLTRALEKIGRAILQEQPATLIFGGGPGIDALLGFTAMENPDLPNFVYAPHWYNPFVSTGDRYHAKAQTAAQIGALADVGKKWNRPVLFGEFGGADHSPDLCPLVRDVYDTLDQKRAHGTIWEASVSSQVWNNENITILNPDGSERKVIAEVCRAYPRAVGGTLKTFTYQAATPSLEIEITNATGPSDLFIPTRHFGKTPRITATGCTTVYDAATGTLTATATTTNVRLTVTK